MTPETAKVSRTFEGKSTPVKMTAEINQWYDATDDWRVTGTTIWVQPDPARFEGKAELFVGARDPLDKNRGKWEMSFKGSVDPNEEGVRVAGKAVGNGIEGEVKGLEANWTYTMEYVGKDFPNPKNPTLFYKIEGKVK